MRRPNAKRLLKAQELFKSAVTEYIIEKGATPGSFYDYQLTTAAGLLHITPYGNWVACRFDDVALGHEFSKSVGQPSNPYSGKWNFHFCIDSLDPEHVLSHFGFFLDRLLEWKVEAKTT